MLNKKIGLVCLSLAIAISLGALGAHSLEKLLSAKSLASFKTAVLYHILISIVLLALYSVAYFQKINKISLSRTLITLGMCLFSGSIYLLSTSSILGLSGINNILGPITPIGGLLLLIGFTTLGFQNYNAKTN